MRRRGDDGTQNHDYEISVDVSGDDKKSCSMRKRDSIRLQPSASDWTNSRQKVRYYRKWENQQRTALE